MKPKFNFIPERQLNKEVVDTTFTVTLTKQRNLFFKKSDVLMYDLEGKYMRMFVDTEKKVIGWAIIGGSTDLEILKDCRVLKINPTSGAIIVGAGRLLKALGVTEVKDNRKLSVKTYVSPLQKDKIYYVELNQKEEETQN
jgi:hypothetical protein